MVYISHFRIFLKISHKALAVSKKYKPEDLLYFTLNWLSLNG